MEPKFKNSQLLP